MEAGYKGLLAAYENKHNPDSIAKYARLFANANDDSYRGVEQDIIHKTSALYNFNRQQRLAEENLRKARNSRMLVAIITLLGLMTIVIVYKKAKNKAKEEKERLTHEYETSINKLNMAKDSLRLSNYDYETKNRKMESEIQELKTSIEEATKKRTRWVRI